MMSEELSDMARRLMIPVNSQAAEAPTDADTFEYANPVTLNNRLILYGNAVIEATDRLNGVNKRLEAAKLTKREAERQLSDFEGRLLRTYPPQKNLSSLKLVQAYIERVAFDQDNTSEQYHELRETVSAAENDLVRWEGKATDMRNWMKAIETASQNITSHLSYVKFGGTLHR